MYPELMKRAASGVFLVAVGAFFLVHSFGYTMGTLSRMGPGYFPALMGGVLIVLGLVIGAHDVVRDADRAAVDARAFFFVCLSILAFAAGLAWFGAVPAILAAVMVSALARRRPDLLSALIAGAVVSLFSWLVFIVVLGLPMRTFRLPA